MVLDSHLFPPTGEKIEEEQSGSQRCTPLIAVLGLPSLPCLVEYLLYDDPTV